MTRALFWLALALLVYFAIRSKLKKAQRRQQQEFEQRRHQQQERQQPKAVEVEAMLRCAHCGVHFPASENVPAGGRDYCSPSHVPMQ